MLDQSGKNYNEYPLIEKLEHPPLRLGYSKNIVIKSLKVSDNDKRRKGQSWGYSPRGIIFMKNQLYLEETIRRRDDNYCLEKRDENKALNFTLHGNTLLVNHNW